MSLEFGVNLVEHLADPRAVADPGAAVDLADAGLPGGDRPQDGEVGVRLGQLDVEQQQVLSPQNARARSRRPWEL
jgi:hypothetical protein